MDLQRSECKVYFLAKGRVKITKGESPWCWPTCWWNLHFFRHIVNAEYQAVLFLDLEENLTILRLLQLSFFVFCFYLKQYWCLYTSHVIPAGRKCVFRVKEVLSVQVVEVGSQNGPCGCRGTRYPAGRISRRNNSHVLHIPVFVGHW